AVDLDTLAGIDKVRGCVEAGAESGSLQAGGDHGADGALAVRAGDVDEAALAMGISDFGEHSTNAREIPFDRLQVVAETVKKTDGVRKCHAAAGSAGVVWIGGVSTGPARKVSDFAMNALSSERGITASSMPCFSRNSLR